MFAPDLSAPWGGASGSVAMLAGRCLGSYASLGGSILVPGRAIQGCVQIPGGQTIQLLSVNLHGSEGLSDRSLQLLADVGSALDLCDLPFM
eukprot:5918391-Pyramimonas_sp.AAC.1